jgi:hypothetical protein
VSSRVRDGLFQRHFAALGERSIIGLLAEVRARCGNTADVIGVVKVHELDSIGLQPRLYKTQHTRRLRLTPLRLQQNRESQEATRYSEWVRPLAKR